MRKILFCQLKSLKAKLCCTSRGQGKSINVMALWSLVTYNRSWCSFVSHSLPVSTFLCAISYFWCIFWPWQTSSDNTIGLKGMGLLFIEGAQVKFEGKTRYYLAKQKKEYILCLFLEAFTGINARKIDFFSGYSIRMIILI